MKRRLNEVHNAATVKTSDRTAAIPDRTSFMRKHTNYRVR